METMKMPKTKIQTTTITTIIIKLGMTIIPIIIILMFLTAKMN